MSRNQISGDQISTVGYNFSGVTTNSTPLEIFVEGISNNRIVLPDNSITLVTVFVVARRTDSGSEAAAYIPKAAFKRDSGAATTVRIGTVLNDFVREDTGAWDVDLTPDTTNGAFNLIVTGQNAKTIQWSATVIIEQYP